MAKRKGDVSEYSNLIKPSDFARLAFGWKAFPYQKQPLDDIHKRVVMCCGRQIGKTEMVAIKGLYFALMYEKSVVLLLAPNQRQSNILFRRMKMFVNQNSSLFSQNKTIFNIRNEITRETQTVMEFENESEVHALPIAEDGANIRGFTARVVIEDEAGYIKDESSSAIMPMLATTKGWLYLVGTPRGVGSNFHKAFEDKKYWHVYHIPSSASPLIDPEFLRKQREELTDLEFRQEYLAEFVSTVGVMFPAEDVDKVIHKDCPIRDRPVPGYIYYLGFDPSAGKHDEAVGIVIEKRPEKFITPGQPSLYVVNTIELKGKTLPEQVSYIYALHDRFNFRKVLIDTTGPGIGIFEPLKNKDVPVEEFHFSMKSKQEVYFNLKRLIEAKGIVLPKHQKLRKQICEMRREDPGTENNRTEYTKIYHPAKSGQDDYPTALVLAVWASKSKRLDIFFGSAKKPFFRP